MNNNVKAAILGSFIGDAMAMGVHWEYDANKIKERYGEVDSYVNPSLQHYHDGKEAGDFTHYGDQVYELLISTVAEGGFDAEAFMVRWRALMKSDHPIYMDHASKQTLEEVLECHDEFDKCGSPSSDLGGASRIAPLLYAYADDSYGLKEAARKQTAVTHNNPEVVEAAGFFAATVFGVLDGEKPSQRMETLLHSGNYPMISEYVKKGLDCSVDDPVEAVAELGKSCPINDALPSTVYLIKKYEDDFQGALKANATAGGDSAARGLIIGMVLGAYNGLQAIPADWIEGLHKQRHLEDLLEGKTGLHYYEYDKVERY